MADTDIAVVGAGPCGSFLSTHLARKGLSVDVFERETFPRFHVGQSLLPMSIPLLEEIGLDLGSVDYSVRKDGALFYSTSLDELRRFDFDTTLDGTFNYAYQVQRGPFDADLADKASAAGADVHFNHSVDDWSERENSVVLTGDWGECSARYLVDATGQYARMARKHDTFHRIEEFGKIASYTLYPDVTNEQFAETFKHGDVLVITYEDAWGWCIRLPDNQASVGLVEKNPESGRSAEAVVEGLRESCDFLESLLRGAGQPEEYHRSANYSFINTQPVTDRTVALGDAYAFLDPIYASAIHRGFYSARQLADELERHAQSNADFDLEDYFNEINLACKVFTRMIDKFYNTNWVQNMFFADNQPLRNQREITSILAGDIWREDNGYQQLLLRSSRGDHFSQHAPVEATA